MEMQDNEFDELFRSKLNGFEIEPSASVWTGIKAELKADKRKRTLVPVLRIAASIIVLIAAGILFFPQNIHTSKHNNKTQTAKTPAVITSSAVTVDHQKSRVLKSNSAIAQNTRTAPASIAAVSYQKENTQDTSLNQTAGEKPPVLSSEQLTLASLNGKQHVVPDSGTVLAIKLPMKDSTPFIAKAPQAITQSPAVAKQDAPVKAKHKIRSIGDLVNVLVAKVDKRKDKFVEFTDTDGDQSVITGINLGIIKIKKGE
jgi:hypothetical protein